ncbi:hypothetical protein PPL_00643 [Heterostelium album PN500]|uniref:WAP domain-containing protein n=1 Tax=Heterostelium pallidum (strain ATCC 26659 / Pp 5 / PN500) TaxID=670386 RepID=D3AX15_HETP5|nr:hypothetical protein PPL_00643 [Heterostelium album PN500]EFA86838.1 hypothetical protein PPL_00643 [Heterostelium album PN500]|eukprot:XP_020438941.1 hypothetical protein PPL_00643 [Heterostelium album PN500]
MKTLLFLTLIIMIVGISSVYSEVASRCPAIGMAIGDCIERYSNCATDSDCKPTQRCCFNGCGYSCFGG